VDYISVGFTIRGIDVGRNYVECGCQSPPESHELLNGATARVVNARNGYPPLRQLGRGITDPDINIERYRKYGFPCCGDFIHIFRLKIDLEHFIGLWTKHLGPSARWFVHNSQQICWYRTSEGGIRIGTVIAHGTDNASLVFHLDSDHCMCVRIDFLEMAHECHESVLVRLKVRPRVGGKNVNRLAISFNDSREASSIRFDPLRNIVHLSVLPRSEPEQH